MDVKKYLERIDVHSEVKPDLETLRLLHRSHLYNVPFENLDIHSGRKIVLEEDKLLNKITDEKRGGFCYELNGAFYVLLKTIGFKVKRVSAGVYDNGITAGPEFDHMALIVNIKGEEYLTDVGFGDSFTEPLKFRPDEIQTDSADIFRIVKSAEDNHYILFRSSDKKTFHPQYRFTSISRKLNEFNAMCEYHQTSPESHFTKKIICSRATKEGRISLSNLKLIITESGKKEETVITEDEFHSLLKTHFNISVKTGLTFPVP